MSGWRMNFVIEMAAVITKSPAIVAIEKRSDPHDEIAGPEIQSGP